MISAIQKYHAEVLQGDFPTDDNSFTMSDDVIATLRDEAVHAHY